MTGCPPGYICNGDALLFLASLLIFGMGFWWFAILRPMQEWRRGELRENAQWNAGCRCISDEGIRLALQDCPFHGKAGTMS